jgi:hypothetical protein
MSAEKSRAEPPLPTRNKLIALAAAVCVPGGVACLVAAAQPNAVLFRIGWGAIVVGVALAAVTIVLEARRAPRLYTQSPTHLFENLTVWHLPVTGMDWAPIDLAYASHLKRLIWIGYAVPAVVLALALSAIFDFPAVLGAEEASRRSGIPGIAPAILFTLTMAGAIGSHRRLARYLRIRLGADSTHMLYDSGTGRIERHEWSAVLTDKARLLIGRRLIMLTAPSGLTRNTVYQEDALRGLVLARVPATSFVGTLRLYWKALTRGNLELCVTVVLAGFVLAVYATSVICPECLRGFGALVREWLRGA